MIGVLVLANDSLLADILVSTLSQEIDIDVVRMTRGELGKGNRYSVVILVDEGESDIESIKAIDLFGDDVALLVIKLSLKSRNIFVYESYQLNNPTMERVIDLVRNFGRANLKKKVEEDANASALSGIALVPPFQIGTDLTIQDP